MNLFALLAMDALLMCSKYYTPVVGHFRFTLSPSPKLHCVCVFLQCLHEDKRVVTKMIAALNSVHRAGEGEYPALEWVEPEGQQ